MVRGQTSCKEAVVTTAGHPGIRMENCFFSLCPIVFGLASAQSDVLEDFFSKSWERKTSAW